MEVIIGGLKKSSLLDFPDKVSAIVFTKGCNFNCGFCHNPVLLKNGEGTYTADYFFDFLKTRQGKLDGVVITGGEPTLQNGLKPFIQKIKEMGFLVKLDSNGYKPEILEDLINEKLIDYIAMDIKAPYEKYSFVTNTKIDTLKIKRSIQLIMNSNIDYEFRTTFMPYYHTIEDFEKIGQMIQGAKHYYLQKFEARTEINNPELKDEQNYSVKETEEIISILKKYSINAELR